MGRRRRSKTTTENPTNDPHLCPICLTQRNSLAPFELRCSTCEHEKRWCICEQCLQRHVTTAFAGGNTLSIRCPTPSCQSCLAEDAIHKIMIKSGNIFLWNDYCARRDWRGTSEQWIKHFGVRCPGCGVPIEKNGGCDNMVCSRCKLRFSWYIARSHPWRLKVVGWRRYIARVASFLYRCFVVLVLAIALAFLFHYQENITEMIHRFPPSRFLCSSVNKFFE